MIGEAVLRFVAWTIRKLGVGTFLSLILLMILLQTLVWGLGQNIRGLEGAGLSLTAWLGLLSGWALARGGWRGWQATAITAAGGFLLVLVWLGRFSGPVLTLLDGLPELFSPLPRSPWQVIQDLQKLAAPLENLWRAASIPAVRFIDWATGLARGQAVFDPLANAFLWSLVVWSLAVWAAWAIRRRRQPLPAILPAGLLLAGTLNYTRAGIYLLLPFLAGTLLLCALVHFLTQQQGWEATGVDYSEDIRFDLGIAMLGLTLIVTSVAAITPSLSIQNWVDFRRALPSEDLARSESVARSLGLNPRPRAAPLFGELRSPGLPRSHLIGSGPELSEQLVMVVQVDEPQEQGMPVGSLPARRYYWRGLTYDRYTGRGWATSRIEIETHPAGESLNDPTNGLVELAQNELRQQVQVAAGPPGEQGWLLYAAGTPVQAETETRAAQRSHEDLFGVLVSEREYTTTSSVSRASPAQLRSAGQDYPQWVRDRYLVLPESLPDRVRGLGRDLTASALTPYDRASAIEAYLREIPYSLDVPAPPSGRDVSDFFLFDLRRGYCDYYATAMVVLARAAGLPSRLATGYASGTYSAELNAYQVSEADAHSWVEVYFPVYGWVTFEPTGGRPPVERRAQAELQQPPPPPEFQPSREVQPALRVDWGRIGATTAALAILLALSLAAWVSLDGWRLRRLSPSRAVFALYRRLYRLGLRLSASGQAMTPHEFATHLESQIAMNTPREARFSPAAGEIGWLAALYARTAYSPHPPDLDERARAIWTWRKLRWRLWLWALIRRLHNRV